MIPAPPSSVAAASRKEVRLVVFAHTPPPLHGQSHMVKLMLDGFGADPALGIRCFHVNARVSDALANVGRPGVAKIFRLLRHIAQAWWLRFRHGADTFYYVPAPPQRTPLARDWLVLLLCRPVFRKVVFHWHAAGLAGWLQHGAKPWERRLTRWLHGRHQLSIVLSAANDPPLVEELRPRILRTIQYGVPDPGPDYATTTAPARRERAAARRFALAATAATATDFSPRFRVLFISLCSREKGLFDTLDALALLNAQLAAQGTRVRAELVVAGAFPDAATGAEFHTRCRQLDLQLATPDATVCAVRHVGFVTGDAKHRLYAEADVLCFPTKYPAESFGLVVVEALAFGLPVVATRWRAMPEVLPPAYPTLVSIDRPAEVAAGLAHWLTGEPPAHLRAWFLERYSLDHYLAALAEALHTTTA